jgi:hypothetical protein
MRPKSKDTASGPSMFAGVSSMIFTTSDCSSLYSPSSQSESSKQIDFSDIPAIKSTISTRQRYDAENQQHQKSSTEYRYLFSEKNYDIYRLDYHSHSRNTPGRRLII